MAYPTDFQQPSQDRRKLHRLRELVRGSAETAELLEKLLAMLDEVPAAASKTVSALAIEPTPLHERAAMVLQRCLKALQAQGAALWRWTPSTKSLSLLEAQGLVSEALEPYRAFAPKPGHPLFQACHSGLPQKLQPPAFLRPAPSRDITLPNFAVYVPILAFGKTVGVLMLSSGAPMASVPTAALSELGAALGAVLPLQPM